MLSKKKFEMHFKILDIFYIFIFKGSKDNMSVILIALPACVKEDSSAKEAENKLNQILKDETEKFIVAHVSRDIS